MSEDEIKEKEYQEYCNFVKRGDEAQCKNTQTQDKIVITISSGLFGLLLTILDKGWINVSQSCAFKALLISNAATLILALLAFSTANQAIKDKSQAALHEKNTKGCWEIITEKLKLGYLLTTCLTIVFLTAVMWQIF